jgi:hypothetical protein
MFLQKYEFVTISNNGKYYRALGYGPCNYGEVIKVKVADLPKQSMRKVLTRCDDCGKEWEACYGNMVKSRIHRCFPCARKYVGQIMDCTNIIAASKNRIGPKHQRWKADKKDFEAYKAEVQRHTRKSYQMFEQRINPKGVPRSRCGTEGGYQLDHKTSIRRGYDEDIPAFVIGNVNNLQMLPWQKNRAKGHK